MNKAIIILLCFGAGVFSHADHLYLENFEHPTSWALADVGWSGVYNGTSNGGLFNADGQKAVWVWHASNGSTGYQCLIYTDEYTVNPAAYAVIYFRWDQRMNSVTTPAVSVAVKVGGSWYVSKNTSVSTRGPAWDTFLLHYDPAKENWDTLNAGTAQRGAGAASNLSGDITGFGLHSDNGPVGGSGCTAHIDNFTITMERPTRGADFDGSGYVDLQDFSAFAGSWQCSTGDPAFDEIYDLDFDTAVDVNDLIVFVRNWLLSTIEVTVNTANVLSEIGSGGIGINFNYIRDDNANWPNARSMQDAMRDMEVKWIRYPGGQKSDFHRFSTPPYTSADPQVLGWYVNTLPADLLDFDEYIQYCNEIGVEPFVVVPYESIELYEQAGLTGTTVPEYSEHAAAWVNYANVIKGYNVKYWEVGNENWHSHNGYGLGAVKTIGERTADVKVIAEAMKAVDPTILIGASGVTISSQTTQFLDFFTASNYYREDFTTYRDTNNANLLTDLSNTIQGINNASLNVPAYGVEFGCPYGDLENDLAHAIQVLDLSCQIMRSPQAAVGMMWNTRWMEWDDLNKNAHYALNSQNGFNATGMAVAIPSQFLNNKSHMIGVTVPSGMSCSAGHDSSSDSLAVILINKTADSKIVNVNITASYQYNLAEIYTFQGSSLTDMNPTFTQQAAPVTVSSNSISSLLLPRESVVVVDLY